jgi:hypothetical protein
MPAKGLILSLSKGLILSLSKDGARFPDLR